MDTGGAWQIIKPKHKPKQKQKARRRSPASQICVSPSKGQQSKQLFSVQRLRGFRQVVTRVQSQQKDEL